MCYMKCRFEDTRGQCRRRWRNYETEWCPHEEEEESYDSNEDAEFGSWDDDQFSPYWPDDWVLSEPLISGFSWRKAAECQLLAESQLGTGSVDGNDNQ